jgi:nickel-dependent lactate racemase
MGKMIKLPQLVWEGAGERDFILPEKWEVEVCKMQGHGRAALARSKICKAVSSPIGTPPIREMARGKKEIVIIFDDIQRATRIADILPAVLEELAEAGISDKQIRLVAATGCHAAMDRYDFVKKLDEESLRRFPVYNHNAFGNCLDIGQTSLGTRVRINAEVMACDFKIGIGSVVPHVFAGFGGGAKIILPGICHFDTVMDFHQSGARFVRENADKKVGIGVLENNLLRRNMDEAAQMAGLDMIINTLMNSLGETAAVYAGSLKGAYAEAVKDAQSHYDTPQAVNKDIVIANSFAKAAESESGLEIAFPSVKKEGGEVVLIANAPEGHVSHYLGSPWGKSTKGKFQVQCALAPNIKRLIIYSEYPDLTIYGYFAHPERVALMSSWDEVVQALQKAHPGKAEVAVYPNADIQYCRSASGSRVMSFGDGN